MRQMGLRGAVRGRAWVVTTRADDTAARPADVEFATLRWVDWFNNRRLLEPIGHVPPAEYEALYYESTKVA